MTAQDQLRRDIETLKDSVRLNWRDIGTRQLSAQERAGIKQNIKWCLDEMKKLYDQLESTETPN